MKKIYIITFIVIGIVILVLMMQKNRLKLVIQTSSVVENSEKKYIKWVECNLSLKVLEKTAKLDIDSHINNEKIKYNWIELIAYLASKYGNDFNQFKQKDLDNLIGKLQEGKKMEDIAKDLEYYPYYLESYSAILKEFIGEYEIEVKNETNEKIFEKRYGIKVFHPIAKGYSFSHYKDFGNSRSYGYKRQHLGNDLMGNIGTPIIALESGIVEACGWNQYGGWRIGIRSFDGKRYYYYAHLRKNTPFVQDMYEGKIVRAGDVIGYLGMTGYSNKENTNNINTPHLHFGMQLIFDASQKEGNNQIWLDVYNIMEFLRKNQVEVYKKSEEKDHQRKYDFMESMIYD